MWAMDTVCGHHQRIDTAFGPFCMVCGHLEEETHAAETVAIAEEPLESKPIEVKIKAKPRDSLAHSRAPIEKASLT